MQPAAGQERDIGCLPRHECRLPLGKDEDSGHEAEPRGDAGQIAEHHKRVVKWVVLGVRTGELGRPIRMDGTEHVIVREKVVKAHALDRCTYPANGRGIASELDLRIDSADLHGSHSRARVRCDAPFHRSALPAERRLASGYARPHFTRSATAALAAARCSVAASAGDRPST